MKLAVLGAGSWGTALSIVLAPRFGEIHLWVYEKDLADRLRETRENDIFRPGFKLPENVAVTRELNAVAGADIVLGVMPSRFARQVYSKATPHFDPAMTFVSATKGLEPETLLRMSQVLAEVLPFPAKMAVLSGPTFAREIARGDPAAVVVASG